jgi:hypothetical protein
VFYDKCPDQEASDHWLLFSFSHSGPVRVEKCGLHGGPVVLEGPLKKGWADLKDSDRGYATKEPQPYLSRKEELVP